MIKMQFLLHLQGQRGLHGGLCLLQNQATPKAAPRQPHWQLRAVADEPLARVHDRMVHARPTCCHQGCIMLQEQDGRDTVLGLLLQIQHTQLHFCPAEQLLLEQEQLLKTSP